MPQFPLSKLIQRYKIRRSEARVRASFVKLAQLEQQAAAFPSPSEVRMLVSKFREICAEGKRENQLFRKKIQN
jgi:hypothetical protein